MKVLRKKLIALLGLSLLIVLGCTTDTFATTKNDYPMESISTYTNYLKSHYEDNKQYFSNEYEHILLKRTFLENFGESTVKEFYRNGDKDYINVLNWLTEDTEALKMLLIGGNPEGTYAKVLENLKTLYANHKTEIQEKNIYKKVVIALSLAYSVNIKSYLCSSELSNIEKKYEIYKQFYDNNLLDNKKQFEKLPIELLRYVIDNHITDNELIWLNHYARKYPTNNKLYDLNPYKYIKYKTKWDYNDPKYYNSNNKKLWDKKYELSKYNIPYGIKGEQKLWMLFEEGAVCGGISETGELLNEAFGIPSLYIAQPGHAAYLIYSENNKKEGLWFIGNDVSGFAESGKDGRMPLNWGTRSSPYIDGKLYFNVSYILLAQAALNDYANYEKASEYNFLANIYANDFSKSKEIYDQALNIQKFNLDALKGLIDTYKNHKKTQKDYSELAKKIAENLTYYPLPLTDLLKTLNDKIDTSELKNETLQKAMLATKENSLQPNECKSVAASLADNNTNIIKDINLNIAIAKQLHLNRFPKKEDLKKLTILDITNQQVKDFSGLEYAVNLTEIQAHGNQIKKGLSVINRLPKLTILNLDSDGLSQEQLDSINFEKLSNLKNIYFAGNHFFNVEKLDSLKKVNYEWNSLFNQSAVEEKQTITQGKLTLRIKNIKNIDGSLPTIFPKNGGKYDATTGIISWDDLPVNATSVSYVWQGKNSFSGTVTIPIEYPKEEGHGQAQVTYNVNTATPSDPT
ncbi:hypothetical protein ACTPL8_002866, partial [Enterococcus faecium]